MKPLTKRLLQPEHLEKGACYHVGGPNEVHCEYDGGCALEAVPLAQVNIVWCRVVEELWGGNDPGAGDTQEFIEFSNRARHGTK